jgi:two-component system, LytTR family, sensor kinase
MQAKSSLRQWAMHYKLHHLLLWGVYYVFWVSVYRSMYESLKPLLAITGIYLITHALGYYTTLLWPYRKYLLKGKTLTFLAVFILILLATSGLLGTALIAFSRGTHIDFFSPGWTIYVIALFSNGTTIGILLAIKIFLDRQRNQRQLETTRKKHLESELEYLKAQINPHFLFNAINSIYVLIKRNPDLAADTLIKLSDLLRFQLYECSVDKIPIEKELEYLRNFVDLEKMRRGEKVKVLWDQQDSVRGFTIAPLLLIPFVENAFKFVSNHSDIENKVDIRLRKEDGRFEFTLRNTTEPHPQATAGGIGIQNVKRRLDLLYPQKHTLNIRDTPEIFTVELTLETDD